MGGKTAGGNESVFNLLRDSVGHTSNDGMELVSGEKTAGDAGLVDGL